jgi:chaperonin GroEL
MSRKYKSGNELHKKIMDGANTLANNVAATLGPRGRNVILYNMNVDSNPIITKDGVTVARFVRLEDPFENVGAQIIKQAASQTNFEAGDGTTTSTVLTRAILEQSQKYLVAGAPPVEMKRGIDKTVEKIVENLEKLATPIKSEEDVAHIATISANGDSTIGKLISTAVDLAGKDGSITIEEARSVETSLDIVEGFRFDSGYLASAFITDEKRGTVRYEDPLILVTDERLETVEEMMPALELAAREGRPFIIVAENIEGQALAALIMNATRGTLRVAAIKAPRYGVERRNILKDLALSVGATFITRENNLRLRDVKLTHMGSAKTIESLKNLTTIVDGAGDLESIEKQIDLLKVEIEQTESLQECEKIQERITRLASGIAIIRVGAPTEIEMIEKKHRIEDALEAVRSAQQEGIVPGGGIAIIRASENLDVELDNEDQRLGLKIVLEAIKEPVRQMALNAGESPDIILSKVASEKDSKGYDFSSGNIVDMLEAGIVDPVKVTRCALQNAASAAGTLITTNNAIIES